MVYYKGEICQNLALKCKSINYKTNGHKVTKSYSKSRSNKNTTVSSIPDDKTKTKRNREWGRNGVKIIRR